MSLIVLLPLLATLFVSLCASFYFLKRKSLAQSHCLQQASILQDELKKTLDRLLQLNRQAKILRQQRSAADQALKAALSSLNPYAIAAAQAYWTAVYMQQLSLRTRQESLLRQASIQRQNAHRRLSENLRSLRVAHVDSKQFYWRALAVEATPLWSLTPDYRPLPGFSLLQQHQFRFTVDLKPEFLSLPFGGLKQVTQCSVSLKGKEKQWNLKVIAASAPSKLLWSLGF